MKNNPMKARIYVCHTIYHVYVSVLKELALPRSEQGKASLVLSRMSNNFGNLGSRALASGLFAEVFDYDEKRPEFFPELEALQKNRGNILLNSFSRIRFTRRFAKFQAAFVPVDFNNYKDIYVYCDKDPIGIYLSQNHIYYHALEDGLNYLKPYAPSIPAVNDNKGAFALKKFMSDRLNLIFIQDGFNKYCLDMEVNDISVIAYPCRKYKEVPRHFLTDRLTPEDKEIILGIFVSNLSELRKKFSKLDASTDNILILTEPLTKDLKIREKIFRDLLENYSAQGTVFFKPHPRDELDYGSIFPDVPQFEASMPMEILNFFSDLHFKKAVSIFTQTDAIKFADEKETLGCKFMDKYEDPSIHSHLNM